MIFLITSNSTTNAHIQFLNKLREHKTNIASYSIVDTSLEVLPFSGISSQSNIISEIVYRYEDESSLGKETIIYYPETCLHPSSQSTLIKQLIQEYSKNNLDLYLVSNSDHILNGLRSNVVTNIIPNSEISILFFNDENKIDIKINSNGGIDIWPNGFFDQLDADFNTILGI